MKTLAILCGILVAITPLKALSAEPPDIDIKYLYRHEGSKQFEILTEGSILYSGDFYKIIFAPATTEKKRHLRVRFSDRLIRQHLSAVSDAKLRGCHGEQFQPGATWHHALHSCPKKIVFPRRTNRQRTDLLSCHPTTGY
jgi:hypothetical protein